MELPHAPVVSSRSECCFLFIYIDHIRISPSTPSRTVGACGNGFNYNYLYLRV